MLIRSLTRFAIRHTSATRSLLRVHQNGLPVFLSTRTQGLITYGPCCDAASRTGRNTLDSTSSTTVSDDSSGSPELPPLPTAPPIPDYPCPRLDLDADAQLPALYARGWTVVANPLKSLQGPSVAELAKTYAFNSFKSATEFVNEVSKLATTEKVRCSISTFQKV
jgi:hypothetical protein